ncbi:MAG: flagellar hook protein FlgE [Candidatus Dadabacteria bacterium]|nr:MAG: flagellar hook protein FlgE [Candidatus Dadabacteria bacterium]
MPSIVNGLFSGRSGISSHGSAIAVIGDNIANSSTIGFKAARAEFEDLIAGGQTSGKVIGSGSAISAVSTIFEQGSFEFTGRDLDLAIDGNGFFVVEDSSGQRFYTRAGNFRINSAGIIVNQNDQKVLGFPSGGSGALQELSINTVSQDSVATTSVTISGNLDASATPIDITNDLDTPFPVSADGVDGTAGSTNNSVTYSDLNNLAEFSTVVEVFDTLGESHTVTFFFYRDDSATGQWVARGYVNSEEVDTDGPPPANTGVPRQIGTVTLNFDSSGQLTTATPSFNDNIQWNNGASTAASAAITFSFSGFTQYASGSNIDSITQDGQGIGAVTSVSIESNGDIFALLSNGQSAIIGNVGLVNFSNPEGLTRVGQNLLQQSAASGEPIVGRAETGTFGSISSGSIELSTVDIANEFVKIITLQRGFQANSRIITTINQLLNEIIQLA